MTCSDVERELPEFLEGTSDRKSQAAFESHMQSCPACSDLVSDLKLITSEARQLAETDEPAPRVWVRIAAELRAEGLIREPEDAGRLVLVSEPRRRWNSWWLAPVAAALVAAGAYVVSHKPAPQVAVQAPAPAVAPVPATQAQPPTSVAQAPTAVVPSQSSASPQVQVAQKSLRRQSVPDRVVESAPSSEDQQFLSVVSTLSPAMRTTYENQLQALNADIRETQAYVNRNPGDLYARQHLIDAYQQKALLYEIALDRIQ